VIAEGGAKIVTPKPLLANLMLTVYDESQARILTYGKVKVLGEGNVSVMHYDYKYAQMP
jgi:hypothetical protein